MLIHSEIRETVAAVEYVTMAALIHRKVRKEMGKIGLLTI
jgi:hypothetical protein